MQLNQTVTEFHLARLPNGENFIEVHNDFFTPGIVTIIEDKLNKSPMIVMKNLNDPQMRSLIMDEIYAAFDALILSYENFAQFAREIDGRQFYHQVQPDDADDLEDVFSLQSDYCGDQFSLQAV